MLTLAVVISRTGQRKILETQVNTRAGAQALPHSARSAGASRVAALSTAVRQQFCQGLPATLPRSAAMATAPARQQLTVR